jgi:hypothetical protein
MKIRHAATAALGVFVLTAAVAGCGSTTSATSNDQKQTNSQLDLYQKNQPIPLFPYSQYRQDGIDIESAQVHGVATTSFFFNQGATAPYKVCSSIGFPFASTSQLTNPLQIQWGANNAGAGVVAQMEPNGTYTGDSTGTYVVCVAANGAKFISYAEGYVHTEGGPAHWDNTQHLVVDDGAPTVTTTGGK